MFIQLDDDLVNEFTDWAHLQSRCNPDHPLGQLTAYLELQMGRDRVERKRAGLLHQGPPRNECPGCFSALYDKAAEDGWCLNCKHLQPAYERWWKEAHKRMTFEEYMALPLVGWHKVCKNIDGMGGIGVQYLPQTAEHGPNVRPGKDRRTGSKSMPNMLPVTEQTIPMPPTRLPRPARPFDVPPPPQDKETTVLPHGMQKVVCPDCGVECTGPGYPLLHSCREQNQPLVNPLDEARELLQRSLDNFEDDIEEKPMRHSLGNLIARLRTILRRPS